MSRSKLVGVLQVQWIKGVVLFYVEQQTGDGEWTRILSGTRVKHEITGLTTGKEYSYASAIARNGVSSLSEVVSQMVA